MADKKKTPAPAKNKKPAPKPVKTTKPAPKPTKPAKKPPQKQPVKPSKPAPKPMPKPAPKPMPKPAQKPMPKPVPKTMPKPAPKPVAQQPKPVEKKEPPRPAQPVRKGIRVGDMAPDFTLKDQFGNDVKLSALKGKKVLLSFHPLAWTPICELQMRALELKKSEFDKLNTVPLGLSIDSMYSKREWATFMELDQVQILADFWPHGEVAKKYGQFIDKGGVSGRVNILVDENGKVAWVKIYDIKQLPDIEEVMAAIRGKSPAR